MTEQELEAEHNAAYNQLRDLAAKFNSETREESGLDISIDFGALWNLTRSYVDDVHRYSSYHDAPIPDKARRCAYLCKWLMKFRPLVVLNPSAPRDEEIQTFSLMANEIFTAWCVSALMTLDWSEVSNEIRLLLLYSLRHRFNSEDTYILFFAHLCDQ